MSALFDKEESNVRRHILNAFREGELERDENNVQKIHVNGVKKPVPFYSLDVIISVGYRVHSKRGTAFRIWARKIIKEYLIHGGEKKQTVIEKLKAYLNKFADMLSDDSAGFDVYRNKKLNRVEDDEAFEDDSYLMAAEPLLPPDPD